MVQKSVVNECSSNNKPVFSSTIMLPQCGIVIGCSVNSQLITVGFYCSKFLRLIFAFQTFQSGTTVITKVFTSFMLQLKLLSGAAKTCNAIINTAVRLWSVSIKSSNITIKCCHMEKWIFHLAHLSKDKCKIFNILPCTLVRSKNRNNGW